MFLLILKILPLRNKNSHFHKNICYLLFSFCSSFYFPLFSFSIEFSSFIFLILFSLYDIMFSFDFLMGSRIHKQYIIWIKQKAGNLLLVFRVKTIKAFHRSQVHLLIRDPLYILQGEFWYKKILIISLIKVFIFRVFIILWNCFFINNIIDNILEFFFIFSFSKFFNDVFTPFLQQTINTILCFIYCKLIIFHWKFFIET